MALTLEELLNTPTEPDALNDHLIRKGYIPPAPSPAAPAPVSVAPMTRPVPVAEPPAVQPMTKPAMTMGGTPPAAPEIEPPNVANKFTTTPIRSLTGVSAAPSGISGVQPMTPPAAPTPVESREAGRAEYAAVRPQVTAQPGSAEYWQQRLNQEEFDRTHPWGSDISAHPGLLGKIGHIAGRVGNIAGNIVAPGVMANIPGTALNRQAVEAETAQELGKAKEAESTAATQALARKNVESEIAKREGENKQELVQDQEGNVTGWKDKTGAIHGIDEEGTPQGIKDVAADWVNKQKSIKPTFEKMDNGDIVALKTDEKGNVASQVVYKGDPKLETEIAERTVGGQEHKILINKKTGEDIKDLGAYKTEKSAASQLADLKFGEQLVRGFDKDGNERMMPQSQAKEAGLTHISKATDKEWDDAKQNTAALNDMGAKVKNIVPNTKALDQGAFQRTIIARSLAHGGGGTIDQLVRAGLLTGATDETKAYVQDILSLREAALALPKQTTGGSRVSEPQAEALWKTIPDASGDSKYAMRQLRKFDENLARLWKKVPGIEGQTQERPFGKETSAEGAKGGGTAAPAGKTSVWSPDGTQHFVDSNKLDKFLKDPNYKGWTKNAP